MTTIVVPAGTAVRIQFSDSPDGAVNVDGEFEVHFDSGQYPDQIVVKESAGLPGSVLGGANAVLYREKFGTETIGKGDKTPTVKKPKRKTK